MATSDEFYRYITENLSAAGNISCRKMMGEYLVYHDGKLIGSMCDNVFLVKQTETSVRLLEGAEIMYPYEGSKTPMLAVDCVENTELMSELLEGLYRELPDKTNKSKRSGYK